MDSYKFKVLLKESSIYSCPQLTFTYICRSQVIFYSLLKSHLKDIFAILFHAQSVLTFPLH